MPKETPLSGRSFLGEALSDPREGALAKYRRLVFGEGGILGLLRYELLLLLFSNIPGALGILLRRIFYRPLFKRMGRGVIIGTGVTLRHPGRISLGNHVAIDDYCTLDARGENCGGITLGDRTIVSRFSILRTKEGTIEIGAGAGIGSHSILASTSSLVAGEHLLLAPASCIIAGGQHAFARADVPIVAQGMISKGGVSIGDDVWIGSRATILDGVKIGAHAIVGACALVNKEIPAYAIAYGVPAKQVGDRRHPSEAGGGGAQGSGR
ncbi:MAG: acyltransferase [Candidatus Aureabacteria bacterium]|nr:acyltransferase [Candidatus Auribacterota bacterium]NLW93692.1 acyltransferase [Chlamydiota bacterium]HQM51836.1 acyltransferase [bacterium]